MVLFGCLNPVLGAARAITSGWSEWGVGGSFPNVLDKLILG